MKNLQTGGDNPDQLNQLTNMMGDLFKNLGADPNGENKEDPAGVEHKSKEEGLPDMSKKFEDMFSKFENAPNFDNFATKLLHEFMDKEILEEPLKEAKKSYDSYLLEKATVLSPEEMLRYRNQEKCIDDLLVTLEKEPNNKEHLIALFEKMQEFGAPPEEITKNIEKDNPFKMFQNMQEMSEGQAQKQPAPAPDMNMNMDPNNCRLF